MTTTGNPILDNPALKAALAAQMQQTSTQPPQSAIMPPGGEAPAPAIRTNELGGVLPDRAGPPIAPAGRGTSAGDSEELARKLRTGSGISQISGKIENSGFGQAHPLLGKIAGIGAQGLAQLGDIGLRTVAPALDVAIPGTSLHHQADIHADQRQVSEDTANEAKQAQTEATQAEVPLRQAEARKAGTEAEIAPSEAQSRLQLQDAQIQHLLHPEAANEFQAWRQQNPSAPVEDWLKAQGGAKNQRPDTPEQQFIDEYTRKNPNGTVADAIHAYAAATQKPERGPTIIQQTGEADKIATRLGKPYETAATQAQAKLDRIDQTLHSVNAGYVGQGLAIPELLTSLVSGQGTGVRITQPELNAITAHRGIQGNAESWFNSLAGKGSLTEQDKQQIKGVLGEAKARLVEKQNIMNAALDSINGAESRAEVVQADKTARQQITDLERSGHYVGQKITLKDGSQKAVTAIHPDGSFDAN